MKFLKTTKNILLIGLSLLSLSIVGCSNGTEEKELTIPETTDKYGTFYEIFPYAFADSDGDGIGDIKGISDKLDYIDSLHYDGIWLTPIHESPSYHKYDVVDYKTIDSSFGTLSQYDALVTSCHSKGMKILLDLVFNHSSSENSWFINCLSEHSSHQTSAKYYNFYNIKNATSTIPSGWRSASALGYSQYMYEGQFTSEMPDLNLQDVLDNPDGKLATELKDIMKFWLIDHNVDGFRLDAVTSYFTGNQTKTGEFLKWMHDYCVSIKPSVYIVGEGSWSTPTENLGYQTASGVDSFFNFEDQGASGYPARVTNSQDSTYLAYGIKKNLASVSSTGIPAPFIANHDTGRLYAAGLGSNGTSSLKLLNAVLQMMNGCTFSYYGDEAGMNVLMSSSGKYIDQDKRQPMPWGDSYTCKPVGGSTSGTDAEKYPLGTIKDQLADKDSLVNYVSKVNKVRRAFPEIARGETKEVFTNDANSFSLVSKTYKDTTIYIALNAAKEKSYSCDIKAAGVSDDLEVAAQLQTSGSISLSNGKIEVPGRSIAILAKKGSN
jgi:glycosidase